MIAGQFAAEFAIQTTNGRMRQESAEKSGLHRSHSCWACETMVLSILIGLLFVVAVPAQGTKSQNEENHGAPVLNPEEVVAPCPDSELAIRQMPMFEAVTKTEDDEARAFASTMAGHMNDVSCIAEETSQGEGEGDLP